MITHAVLIGADLGPGARGAEDFEMSDAGHSRPMRYAPVSQHVSNGLKADVPGKWRNGKTATRPHGSSTGLLIWRGWFHIGAYAALHSLCGAVQLDILR